MFLVDVLFQLRDVADGYAFQRLADFVSAGIVRGQDLKTALSEAAVRGERGADLPRADDDDFPLLA